MSYPLKVAHEEVFVSVDLTAQILYCSAKLTVDVSVENKEYLELDFAVENIESCQVNDIQVPFELASSVSVKERISSQIESKVIWCVWKTESLKIFSSLFKCNK